MLSYKLFFWFLFGLFITGSNAFSLPKQKIKSIIQSIEKEKKLPKQLLSSIIWQESSYRVKAYNGAHNEGVAVSSYGLGQLTLDTAQWHCKLSKREIYDPIKNIECSAKVLSYQLKRYNFDIPVAVAAYNWGTPCVCDGKYFRKAFRTKVEYCSRRYQYRGKVIYKPITCDAEGFFFNQQYVDDVLYKRNKLLTKYSSGHTSIYYMSKEDRLKIQRAIELEQAQSLMSNNIVEIENKDFMEWFKEYHSFQKKLLIETE